jgi:hypothetical protein
MANKFVVFHIQDKAGKDLSGALLTAESAQHGPWSGITNACGDFKTPKPGLAPGDYALTVRWRSLSAFRDVTIGECTADNEGSGEIVIGLEHGAPTPQPPSGPLQRLTIAGQYFALADGTRWTAIECSDFNLFGRYLNEGADAIRPVLAQRRDCGFNLLRVWTNYSGSPEFEATIGRLLPSEHPEMYTALPGFLALCASYGLYVELVAFTAAGDQTHWSRLAGALHGEHTALVELVNENDAHTPNLDPADYAPIPGVLCAHGSNGSQQPPIRPWWNYETVHYNDAFEWQRKVGHNAMEWAEGGAMPDSAASHVPILSNENTRYPDRDSSLVHAYDAAAGAALLCAGSCYHSVHGKKSALWPDDIERDCAMIWVNGAKSVPMEFQAGRYIRRDDLLTPELLRVYERRLDDGHGHVVEIRR